MKNSKKISTVVLHSNPDLEALTGLWLLSRFPEIAKSEGLEGEIVAKFIPSGPLRIQDWSWVRNAERCLNSIYLEEMGYLFFDCGGGRLDQHGKEEYGHNHVSSLQLLMYRYGLNLAHPELAPLMSLISANDLHATDVAARHDYRHSPTPNTPRHIRNMVAGWNLMYPDNPHMVAARVLSALDCIYAGILKDQADGVERPANERTLYDNIFLLARRAGKEKLAKEVAESGEQALDALEAEWRQAVQDYWNPDACDGFPVISSDGIKQVFVVGISKSTRFGQVTRLGNVGKHRPEPKRQIRPKADVTLQWRGKGLFVLSSRKRTLDDVATALRVEDHKKRFGIAPNEVVYAAMACRGEYYRPDGKIGLYSAEHGKGVGNAFNSNAEAEPTVLSYKEVVDIVSRVLAG